MRPAAAAGRPGWGAADPGRSSLGLSDPARGPGTRAAGVPGRRWTHRQHGDGPWTVAGFTGKFSGHRHGPVTAAAAAACQWRRRRRLSEALSGTAAILSQCS